ncbi:MAG: NAD+ synthase [Coriobacteriia bacterium]|jgi:NAD+ synthase (glutamine-hydrolysing)|nr:NAD+ synthase [Coriobacteriia bacterium]
MKGQDVRIGLAQLNTVVGDITDNAEQVLEAIARAEDAGCELVVFPEMTLTGYPPEGLLADEQFVSDNRDALQRVAAACTKTAVILGFADHGEGTLYNAAALCADGRVKHVYHKRVPSDDPALEEHRYFAAGEDTGVFDVGDTRVMVAISDEALAEGMPTATEERAALVVNLAARPFRMNETEAHEKALRKAAGRHGAWLVSCNLVGAQDELVFEGGSVIISPAGAVACRASSFAADLLVADVAHTGATGGPMSPVLSAREKLYRALCVGVHDYVHKNRCTDVVLGLSGGMDSALLATIAADALGPRHVHGVMMDSRYTTAQSTADAEALAANLHIDVLELPIEPAFSAFLATLSPVFGDLPADVTEENLQARVRGTLLMALSNKFGWLVLAPGNKSELSVGYTTLYGDMVGGFAPLKDVFKTRVYELARWRNREAEVIPSAILTKPPSAELRPDQTDQDSLPPYDVLDGILARYVDDRWSREHIIAQGHDRESVERVCRMVDAAEYKRRQGPLGVSVTASSAAASGPLPVTNRYRS